MISLIIIAILTMALIGTISINMLNLGNQTEQVVRTLEERTDVIAIKNAIKQELRPVGVNRKLSLPTGVLSSAGYMTLPDSVSIDNNNAWNMEYIYCPYSTTELTGAGNGTVQTAPAEGYNIQTTTYDGKEYIIASTQPTISQYNVLAVIISPIPSATTPQCEDVRYDTTNDIFYTLNYDGVVEVIREETSIISREPVSLNLSSSDSGLRIDQEVSKWSVELPELYTINLDSGSFLTDDLNFINPLVSKGKQVSIIGSASGPTQISGDSAANLTFENTVVVLKDITFNSSIDVNFINSDVYLENVSIASLSIEDSKVKSRGSVVLTASSSITAENSLIDLRDHSAILNKNNSSSALNLVNSKLLIDNLTIQNNTSGGIGVLLSPLSSLVSDGTITINGASLLSGISVDTEASFNLDNGGIDANTTMDTIIYVQGDVDINNSFINGSPSINNAIVMGDGAEFNLSASNIGSGGSATVVGVRDLGGAKFISGQSSTVSAVSNCWTGDIFYLAPSLNGSTSVTPDNNYKMVNKSNWTCSN